MINIYNIYNGFTLGFTHWVNPLSYPVPEQWAPSSKQEAISFYKTCEPHHYSSSSKSQHPVRAKKDCTICQSA